MSNNRVDFAFATVAYHRLFGEAPDFSGLVVPKPVDDRAYLVVPIILGSTRKWFSEFWQCFHERSDQMESYAVLMLDNENPDESLDAKYPRDIPKLRFPTNTQQEYKIFSAIYKMKHDHLPDRTSWTMNTGSRSSSGLVPFANWRGDWNSVRAWGHPDRDPPLRTRRVWV